MKRRVMYFTVCSLGIDAMNGGDMYAQNNVRRLAEDDNIDLRVLTLQVEAQRKGVARFCSELGVEHLFLPMKASLNPWRRLRPVLCSMDHEIRALRLKSINRAAKAALNRWGIDYVITDYLYSLLYWPGLLTVPLSKALITCNRETEMFADRLMYRQTTHGKITGPIARRRVAEFERRVYRAFSKVITIGRPDIPRDLPPKQTACITPFLPRQADGWTNRNSEELFFVGAINHYPNRLAMEYIATELAPRLATTVPKLRIDIIGATVEQVPPSWHQPNVLYLGHSTADEVARRFRTSRFLICPIGNTFGMKFKIAEALSYGTPFLASPESMLCVPYLGEQPSISLDDPESATEVIARYFRSDEALTELQMDRESRHLAFISSQNNIWSRTLFNEST